MASQSARALSWASLLLLLVGGIVGAPEAGVAAAALAGLCALAPLRAGTRGLRLAGLLLLLAAAGLAAARLPSASRGLDAYRARVERSRAEAPGPR